MSTRPVSCAFSAISASRRCGVRELSAVSRGREGRSRGHQRVAVRRVLKPRLRQGRGALGSCRPGTSSDWTGQQQGDGVILILFSDFSGASIDGTSRKQTGAKDHTTHLNLRFHFSDGFLEVFDFRLVQAQRGDFGALDSAQLLAEFARNRGKSPSYVVRVLLRQLEFMINVSLVFKRNRNPSAQVVKKYIRSPLKGYSDDVQLAGWFRFGS